MHYGRQLVVDIKLVYFPCPILLEPYAHARSHVGVYDVNVVISIWELMLVNKTDGMTNFVQIQSFLQKEMADWLLRWFIHNSYYSLT